MQKVISDVSFYSLALYGLRSLFSFFNWIYLINIISYLFVLLPTTVAHCCFGINCIHFIRLHEQLSSAGLSFVLTHVRVRFRVVVVLRLSYSFHFGSQQFVSQLENQFAMELWTVRFVLPYLYRTSRILAIVVVIVYPLIVTFSESWTKLKLNSNSKIYRVRRRVIIIIRIYHLYKWY